MTTYTLLFKEPDEELFDVLPKAYEAGSSDSAVRAAAADMQKAGTYVAIPARSFDPVRIEIETNPRVKVVH
jgi:hypothetical protein